MTSMLKAPLGLLLFPVSLVLVDIPLNVSYVIWALFDAVSRVPSRLGIVGCVLAIPIFAVYVANSVVFLPSFVLMFLVGWIDLEVGISNLTRIEQAQHSFFWPHVIVWFLMPRLYGVEVGGPVGLVYWLRDLHTGETALVMPGPRVVRES